MKINFKSIPIPQTIQITVTWLHHTPTLFQSRIYIVEESDLIYFIPTSLYILFFLIQTKACVHTKNYKKLFQLSFLFVVRLFCMLSYILLGDSDMYILLGKRNDFVFLLCFVS